MTIPGQDYAGDFEDTFSARAGFVWKLGKSLKPTQISLQDKLPTRPKIRPNKYPFEIKKIPKEYARPRVRPNGIEELAAKSRIF